MLAATVAAGLLAAAPAWAGVDLGMPYVETIGLPTTDIRALIAGTIRALMGVLGILLILKVMEGGFILMTHGGNEDRRAEGIATVKNAVIGLAIIMSSNSIARFAVDSILNATNAPF